VRKVTIQLTYHNTGLTVDDVLERAEKSGMFKIRVRDHGVHVMLLPEQHPSAKVQGLNNTVNVWCRDPVQHREVKELLKKTLKGSFKNPELMFNPGELRKIQETPLGQISTLAYYYSSEIADALTQVIQNMDNWNQWQKKSIIY